MDCLSDEKSGNLLLHCLMGKPALISIIYNMNDKYLCFPLFGTCQALTLNICSQQSEEKLTVGQNHSLSEPMFNLLSPNFTLQDARGLISLQTTTFLTPLGKAPVLGEGGRNGFHHNFTVLFLISF